MKKELLFKISFIGCMKLYIKNLADSYAQLFSLFLGEEVSTANVMRITNAILAFTILVFSYGHALYSVIFLCWFILAINSCKKAGIK